jgi:hypothetical protein
MPASRAVPTSDRTSHVLEPEIPRASVPTYEAPRVEGVMTEQELAREIQYAGAGTTPG